jgi:hypothetical protein
MCTKRFPFLPRAGACGTSTGRTATGSLHKGVGFPMG